MEELKHGTWECIIQQHGNATEGFWTDKFLKCSVCGYERKNVWTMARNPNYCEECGADMRGDKNGN
jgi:hypothetical protein